MALKPKNVRVRLQTGTDRTLFATWDWNKSNTDKYEVSWKYDTGDGVWFSGNDGTAQIKQSTYSAPSNAIRVAFKVKAVSKKKGKNGVYWTCSWSTTVKYDLSTINLTDTGAPTLNLVGYKLTATIDDYVAGSATGIQFQLVRDDTTIVETVKPVTLATTHASYIWKSLEPGHKYKVRARAVREVETSPKNTSNSKKNLSTQKTKIVVLEGVWSSYSENVYTGFEQVSAIKSIETYSAYGSTGGVRITWEKVLHFDSSPDSNDEYEIEYTDDETLFDVGDVQTSGGHKTTSAVITGLDLNKTYYFRVRAKADGGSTGAWSPTASMAVGTVPGPPTIWSYLDTIELGSDIILNWVHSSDDGSTQTEAIVTVTINEQSYDILVPGDTSTLTIHTDTQEHWDETFEGGLPYVQTDYIFTWKVKTKGVVPDYGEYSGEKTINVYEPVILNGQVYRGTDWLWDPFTFATDNVSTAYGLPTNPIETVTKYPVIIGFNVTPDSQTAISYSVTITANEAYDGIDATGAPIHISSGDVIYSAVLTPEPHYPNRLSIMLYPGDIDLENNISYTLSGTVAMDSGLSGETDTEFDVAFDDEDYEVEAEIDISYDDYSAMIKPICRDEFGNIVTKVYFNIYRREYDGSFTPIILNLDGENDSTVVDPHPSLDYARYRVVAITKKTGAVSYDDMPGYRIGMDSIVMQWDETWSTFEADDSEELADQPNEGSMLLLPYNIDVSSSHSPDVSLVNYIGNGHPVSYYGTHHGESGSWSCEIPASDQETLYTVRRLANYMGDVYVREPSGIGYWAHVTVSYNIQHTKMTIPVTFNITRVEGGI